MAGLLTACGSSSQAPISDAGSADQPQAEAIPNRPSAPPVPTAAAGPGEYKVQPKDTLFSLSRRFGMTVDQLKSLNGLTSDDINVGQILRTGGGGGASAPAASTASTSAASSTPKAADAGKISWGWPHKGKIITNYSASTRGIDIEGTEGQPVVAAADGVVSYAGNGLRGLGNLILVTHPGGYISAYAHNKSNLVKTNAKVTKGQKIAELGSTDTSSPRLHFEIRKNGQPVNPTSYLP